MASKEQRSALRAAVYRGDGPAVVELLGVGAGADDDSLHLDPNVAFVAFDRQLDCAFTAAIRVSDEL